MNRTRKGQITECFAMGKSSSHAIRAILRVTCQRQFFGFRIKGKSSGQVVTGYLTHHILLGWGLESAQGHHFKTCRKGFTKICFTLYFRALGRVILDKKIVEVVHSFCYNNQDFSWNFILQRT